MKHFKYGLIILIGILLICCPFSAIATDEGVSKEEINVEETAICRNIINRTPIGKGTVFPPSVNRLFCFTKVMGAKTETVVVHQWFLNGDLMSSVTLPVKSASWRTWSSKDIKLNQSGDWMVDVLNSDGDSIETILFFVQ